MNSQRSLPTGTRPGRSGQGSILNALGRSFVACLFLIALAAAGAPAFGQGQGPGGPGTTPPPADVNVVNTPSVTIANTPTVAVDPASNTVTIDSSSPVVVRNANGPTEATVTPVSVDWYCDLMANIHTGDCGAPLRVPAGRRLVIEHVAASIRIPGGQFPKLISVGPEGKETLFAATYLGTEIEPTGPSYAFYAFSQPVKMYADAGSILTVIWARGNGTSSGASITVQARGYLVDVP